MPEMHGLELLEKLRGESDLSDIPVILCSSAAELQSVRRAGELGCTHYLVKPVEPRLLLQRVKQVLEQSRPLIRSPGEMISRFGLDAQAYGELKRGFKTLLEEVERGLKDEGKTRAQGLELSIHRLLEGAVLFGAERLINAIEGVQQHLGSAGQCKCPPCQRLHIELRRVLRALCLEEAATQG